MSDSFGTIDRPFVETPQAATLNDVHWAGGMAVELNVPTADASFIKYDPAMDTAIGALCYWVKVAAEEDIAGGVRFDVVSDIIPGVYQDGAAAGIQFQQDDETGNFIERVHNHLDGGGGSWWPIVLHAPIAVDKWVAVQMSWDMPNHLCTIAIDGTAQVVTFWQGLDDDVPILHTGKQTVVSQQRVEVVAYYDVWLARQYIDFDNPANRARFIDADKKPVPLGPDGTLGSPTTRRPEYFFHCASGDEPETFFTGNLGTEGPLAAEATGDVRYRKVAKPTKAGER